MFIKNTYNKLFTKLYKKDCQITNNVLIIDGIQHRLLKGKNKIIKGLTINLGSHAKNNTISIESPFDFTNSYFYIDGTGCSINIKKESRIQGLSICMQEPTLDSTLQIGEKFACATCQFDFVNTEHISIGDKCMFSYGIHIWAGDGHAIFDIKNLQILNNQKNHVRIGNHCWIGNQVILTKNATIADHTIVGAGSVVTKRFNDKNVIIAGNPAKIIKTDVDWNGSTPNQYKPVK